MRGKIAEAPPHGCKRRHPVSLVVHVRARTRPAPGGCPFDQARPNRIERHIAHRGSQIRVVQDNGAKTALPKMTDAFLSRMNAAGITTMDPRERAPQPVRIRRDQNKMHMVGHQAPGPYGDVGCGAVLDQQVAIERIVFIAEEHAVATIARLGDEGRKAGNNDASETSHRPVSPEPSRTSIDWTVTIMILRNIGGREFTPHYLIRQGIWVGIAW